MTPTSAAFGLSDIVSARGITSDSRPAGITDVFSVGMTLYITYTANNAARGHTLDLKLFLNGTNVALNNTQKVFERDATYRGYYSYTPTRAGQYRAELYYNGEVTPSHVLNFAVR